MIVNSFKKRRIAEYMETAFGIINRFDVKWHANLPTELCAIYHIPICSTVKG